MRRGLDPAQRLLPGECVHEAWPGPCSATFYQVSACMRRGLDPAQRLLPGECVHAGMVWLWSFLNSAEQSARLSLHATVYALTKALLMLTGFFDDSW